MHVCVCVCVCVCVQGLRTPSFGLLWNSSPLIIRCCWRSWPGEAVPPLALSSFTEAFMCLHMCLNACFLSGTCLRCKWDRIWPADASRVATPALLFWSLISSSVSYADSDCVCYSFSRLLTHYNWFLWHNFPNHSYSSRNKDTFLETFNTFHLFDLTLQFAQCFPQNSTQKHHHFAQIQPCSHSENTNTQYNYRKNHKMNTNSTHLSMCEHSGKLPAGSSTYTSHLQYKVAVSQMRGLLLFFVL